jgi:hypothetical protein
MIFNGLHGVISQKMGQVIATAEKLIPYTSSLVFKFRLQLSLPDILPVGCKQQSCRPAAFSQSPRLPLPDDSARAPDFAHCTSHSIQLPQFCTLSIVLFYLKHDVSCRCLKQRNVKIYRFVRTSQETHYVSATGPTGLCYL